MLLPKIPIISALVAAHASASPATVTPLRVSFSSLLNANENFRGTASNADAELVLLLNGLTRDGLVSVADIPSFKETKRALMSNLHACIMTIDGDVGGSVTTQHFEDGTVRRSFATSTLPDGIGAQPIKTLEEYEAMILEHTMLTSCQGFKNHLSKFRSSVDLATRQFAERLSAEMGTSLPKPLLSTPTGHVDYEDINQVVAGGEHLEHFHSYQKVRSDAADDADEATIEFHTDQGFFIAFTPGLIMSDDAASAEALELSGGFYMKDSIGKKFLVNFSDEDDLVFMMGDGANQFINNKVLDESKVLRATSHALTLPAQEDSSKARVWYGRMVLPPNDAYSTIMKSTFGEARHALMNSGSNENGIPLGIGCSSPNMNAVIQSSRNLQECAEDELFCWFRCMPLEDHGLTTTTCTERNLKLQCVNPRGQVHPDGNDHGDYYPECTNSTAESHPVEDYPLIEQQDEEACTPELWEEFHSGKDYDHMVDLTIPNETETMLYWSVVEDDAGAKKIKARLVYNNVFGWLSMGFGNKGGGHNGMNGGNVLLAHPGGNYSAATGLDTSVDGSINSYVIDLDDSAFRHWMTPIESSDGTEAAYEDAGCFVAIEFEGSHINGKEFNFTGTDDLIWAGNHLDYFMGYHGPNRARFTLNWNTEEISFFGEEDEAAEADETEAETAEGDETKVETAENGDEKVAEANDGYIQGISLGMYASVAFIAVTNYLFVN